MPCMGKRNGGNRGSLCDVKKKWLMGRLENLLRSAIMVGVARIGVIMISVLMIHLNFTIITYYVITMNGNTNI